MPIADLRCPVILCQNPRGSPREDQGEPHCPLQQPHLSDRAGDGGHTQALGRARRHRHRLLPLEWAHQHDEATSPGLGGQADGRGMLRLFYDETDRRRSRLDPFTACRQKARSICWCLRQFSGLRAKVALFPVRTRQEVVYHTTCSRSFTSDIL